MPIDLEKIRSFDNSQNAAFEELCCQLAAYEDAPKDSKFIRKAPPDAGIECYWKLHNGDEWGWQVKFFKSPLKSSQWAQLTKSFKTAFKKHPNLTKFVVCLPIDLQDPRIDKEKWSMDKWEDNVNDWKQFAIKRGRHIEFDYWGKHQIVERLSREEHRGRTLFWFDETQFSQRWFSNHIDDATKSAGPRYSPELNFELPITKIFEGLGRTEQFFETLQSYFFKIENSFEEAQHEIANKHIEEHYKSVKSLINEIRELLKIEKNEILMFDFDKISQVASKLEDVSFEASFKIIQIARTLKGEKIKRDNHSSEIDVSTLVRGRTRYFDNLARLGMMLSEYVLGTECKLANTPALILKGEAGKGKTHLFCDIAKSRIEDGMPTVLLLGEQFGNSEPWSQIVSLLGLPPKTTKDDLLGALEANAQARKTKVLIMIDALNEGEGKKIWKKFIPNILNTLTRYPWISIALSVRDSYINTVVPENIISDKIIEYTHEGFSNYEYEASNRYFEYYGIVSPSVPILTPEFQNPLFLKLFCKGLKNSGLKFVPVGLQGITKIFNFYIESVNKKLADVDLLDFDKKSEIVQKSISALVDEMVTAERNWLERERAFEIVNSILPRDGYNSSLFKHLLDESIISEDMFYISPEENSIEGIHFSYERLTHHLFVKNILDDYPNESNISNNRVLLKYFENDLNTHLYSGEIEALSIQIPEKFKVELTDCFPKCAEMQVIRESFIKSLAWRNPRAINENTFNFINEHILGYKHLKNSFFDFLISISPNSEHPLNADFLHNYLYNFSLSRRDSWWSIFLYEQYTHYEHSSISRLINWAWSGNNKENITDDSIRLAGISLSWFLTSSHRYLRDRATKALVSMFTTKIPILIQVIKSFLKVNDPYILERLYAVAYGCTMRCNDSSQIEELAQKIYEWFFDKDKIYPHIFMRDYAKNIIDLALIKGCKLEFDIKKIEPPYASRWIKNVPTEEEIKELENKLPQIYGSVMGYGDFSRYEIGTNSNRFYWSSRKLSETPTPTKKQIYNTFIDSLTKRQKVAWDKFQTVSNNIRYHNLLNSVQKKEEFNYEFSNEELDDFYNLYEEKFTKTLGKKKLSTYENSIKDYLLNSGEDEATNKFDLSIVQKWILKKVLELGWTREKFAEFDGRTNPEYQYGRSAMKPERIGKKYQWIAYHELLARVSDNFEFKADAFDDSPQKFKGPWEVFNRDIDPSCILRTTGHSHLDEGEQSWWFPIDFSNWGEDKGNLKDWIKDTNNLPGVKPLIEVINPKDNSVWLNLDATFDWKPPLSSGEKRKGDKNRTLWYVLKSCLVKKTDLNTLLEFAQNYNLANDSDLRRREIYEVFMGEYYWSPAFYYYYGESEKTIPLTRGYDNKIPVDIMLTNYRYFKERSTYDCSIDDGYTVNLPNQWIVDGMELSWNGKEGHFYNKENELIIFDPSVKESGPRSLLVRKESFLEFMDEEEYTVVWSVDGEKYDYSNAGSSDWFGRLEIAGNYYFDSNELIGKLQVEYSEK